MDAIILENIHHVFRTTTGVLRRHTKEVTALQEISLAVAAGELFGLLGPNGAGKSTTVKILTTLLIPSSGRATVLGLDVEREATALRRHIGFVLGGERGLYYRLSGRDNLRYFAELYHVEPRLIPSRIEEVLELVGLRDRADERIMGYSRGMKQRLHIARMLLHNPKVLFMDEPTQGLDPVASRELRQTIKVLRAEGKTILLTTHYMFEADELCDRIAIIDQGKIIARGTPQELKALVSDLSIVELDVFGIDSEHVSLLKALDFVDSIVVEERDSRQTLRIQTPLGATAVPALVAKLNGVTVGRVSVREATLEDAYVRLVGRVE